MNAFKKFVGYVCCLYIFMYFNVSVVVCNLDLSELVWVVPDVRDTYSTPMLVVQVYRKLSIWCLMLQIYNVLLRNPSILMTLYVIETNVVLKLKLCEGCTLKWLSNVMDVGCWFCESESCCHTAWRLQYQHFSFSFSLILSSSCTVLMLSQSCSLPRLYWPPLLGVDVW